MQQWQQLWGWVVDPAEINCPLWLHNLVLPRKKVRPHVSHCPVGRQLRTVTHTYGFILLFIWKTRRHCLQQRGTLIETYCPVSFHSVNWARGEEESGYERVITKPTYYGTNLHRKPHRFMDDIQLREEFFLKHSWIKMKMSNGCPLGHNLTNERNNSSSKQDYPESRWPKKVTERGSKQTAIAQSHGEMRKWESCNLGKVKE